MRRLKALAITLVVSVIISCVSGLNAYALGPYEDVRLSSDGVWKYAVLNNLTAGIYSNNLNEYAYLGESDDVLIPGEIDGYAVTEIGPFAFRNRTDITSVVIPDSVTYIAEYAFQGCSNLRKVQFGKSISSIAESAFADCKTLEGIELPEGLKELGAEAFAGCALLKEIVFPKQINTIGAHSFKDCASLEKAVIYEHTYDIGSDVFVGCNKLKQLTVYYNPAAKYGGIKDKVTELIVPDNVYEITDNAESGFSALESLTIGKRAEIIADGIFSESQTLDTISGYTGSYAEQYAKEKGLKFNSLGILLKPFSDVSESTWYFDAVYYNARNGFLLGYDESRFGAADSMQRQDFICMLARIAGESLKPYENYNWKFSDTLKGAYYYSSIMWAVDNKLIYGYSDGRFGVGDKITREQICTILYRFESYLGKDTKVKGSPEFILRDYDDVGKVSRFAISGVAWCVQNGVLSGKTKYRLCPTDFASRAEVAQIITNLDKSKLLKDGYFRE